MPEQNIGGLHELPRQFALPGYESLGEDWASLPAVELSEPDSDTLVRKVSYAGTRLVVRTAGVCVLDDEDALTPDEALEARTWALATGRGLGGYEQVVAYDLSAETPFVATELQDATPLNELLPVTVRHITENDWGVLADRIETAWRQRGIVPDMSAHNTLFNVEGRFFLIDYSLYEPRNEFFDDTTNLFGTYFANTIQDILPAEMDSELQDAWRQAFERGLRVLQRRYPRLFAEDDATGRRVQVLRARLEAIKDRLYY